MKIDKSASLLEEATKQMNDGKFSRAFTVLKDLLATDPTHHEGRRLLATLLLKFGNLVTAKNAFDSLLKDAFQHRDYEMAESLLREYLTVGPRCVSFIEMLGEVYERKGDPIAAVIEYEKAIKVLLDDSEPEGTARARELYVKVKSLAPGSFVVGRLAKKFEVASRPSGQMAKSQPAPQSISPPVFPETHAYPPVTVLVSDATAESKSSSVEETTTSPDSSVLVTDVPTVDTSSAPIADADSPSSAVEEPVDTPHLQNAAAEVTPSQSVDQEVPDMPTSSPPLRYATSVETRVQPPSTDSAEEPVMTPPLRFASPAQAQRPVPVSSEDRDLPQEHDVEEKVPFPPVNQMPLSVSTAHSLIPSRHDSFTEPAAQPDEPSQTPFWEKAEEPTGIPFSVENSESVPMVAAREIDGRSHIEEPAAEPELTQEPEPVTSRESSRSIEATIEKETAMPANHLQGAPQESEFSLADSREDHHTPADYPDIATEDVRLQIAPARSRPYRRSGPSIMTRLRVQVSIFKRRCIKTAGSVTRLVLFLVASVVTLAVLGVGVTAVVWLGVEEKPTELYQELTKITAPRLLEDPQTNGYVLLLGFEASPQVSPLQEGNDRRLSPGTQIDESCTRPEGGAEEYQPGWFRSADPAAQFKSEDGRVSEWMASESVFMNRYRQWLGMSFDDWGYGYMGSPDCAHILRVHRLFVADGFSQDLNKGLDRLETDLAAWRAVLAQSKTLSMKSMAAEAIKDDVAVMSGLLSRATLDNKALQRMTRLARPLAPDERSLRWPMQNEFLLEVKRAGSRLHTHADVDSAAAMAIKRMPVPKQRTLNAYAKYYDALIKSPQTQGSLPPKLYDFTRTPARSRVDSFINPLDNLLRDEPMVDWERQIGEIMETDARLRLAGLQARLRGTSSEQQILAKVAQAGPVFFDPFTELPMLLNVAQNRLYSVGRDGKDDGGDATFDISVPIVTKGL